MLWSSSETLPIFSCIWIMGGCYIHRLMSSAAKCTVGRWGLVAGGSPRCGLGSCVLALFSSLRLLATTRWALCLCTTLCLATFALEPANHGLGCWLFCPCYGKAQKYSNLIVSEISEFYLSQFGLISSHLTEGLIWLFNATKAKNMWPNICHRTMRRVSLGDYRKGFYSLLKKLKDSDRK